MMKRVAIIRGSTPGLEPVSGADVWEFLDQLHAERRGVPLAEIVMHHDPADEKISLDITNLGRAPRTWRMRLGYLYGWLRRSQWRMDKNTPYYVQVSRIDDRGIFDD